MAIATTRCMPRRFDAHLCRQGLQQVELPRSHDLVTRLVKQPHENGKTQRDRINLVRHFALFMRRLDLQPTCQITRSLPRSQSRSRRVY